MYFSKFDKKDFRYFYAVAGVLRLSTKYDVSHLRNRTIEKLKQYYPTSLNGYDSKNEWLCITSGWNSEKNVGSRCTDANGVPRALHAVALFRQTDVPSMVPMAMYECCQYLEPTHLHTHTPGRPGWPDLSAADLTAMAKALVKLREQEWRLYITLYPAIERGQCIHAWPLSSCMENRVHYMERSDWMPKEEINLFYSINEGDWEEIAEEQSICSRCLPHVKES
jgi:hypothetical protein